MSENRDSVYSAVAGYVDLHGYGPSVRELAVLTGLALATVQHHIESLIDEGRLSRKANSPRTLRPT